MVKNRGGGWSFKTDRWTQLRRFLILGSAKGTYYASAKEMVGENYDCLLACLDENFVKAIDLIASVSINNEAPKNDPAIFLLAVAASYENEHARKRALNSLSKVCRIPTHLFKFLNEVKNFRGRGRALKRAVADWYNGVPVNKLAYHMVKYQSREGWDHRSALNLFRPNPEKARNDDHDDLSTDEQIERRKALYRWLIEGTDPGIPIIQGALAAKNEEDPHKAAKLIQEFGLTREMVNTKVLKSPVVWEALLEKMPITAMIRNLGNMTKCGLVTPMSDAAQKVIQTVTDEEILQKGRVHPITILMALKIYGQGRGFARNQAVGWHSAGLVTPSQDWTPVQEVVDALDNAFYLAFGVIKPANKRTILGIDVSGSMGGWYGTKPGVLTPAECAAAMAMVMYRTEPQAWAFGFSHQFKDLKISKNDRLDTVLQKTSGMTFGATNCALPMNHALKNKTKADTFVIITDNEVNQGYNHPFQALENYQQKMGIKAKLISVGVTATDMSIADPNSSDMLDVVGFDGAAPNIIGDFSRGDI
jgi:60 kDa SS-A/Ro ribonucleoprotein